MDHSGSFDEKCECRLYIGNLDLRITEATLLKMFSPFGKIVAEDFLWHTRGAKRGEPRGFAFIQFSSKQEAELAKEKMNGKLACGRPLVVRLASEKTSVETTDSSGKLIGEANKPTLSVGSSGQMSRANKPSLAVGSLGQMSRSAKIAAIKNKLKALEEENCGSKKQKQKDGIS